MKHLITLALAALGISHAHAADVRPVEQPGGTYNRGVIAFDMSGPYVGAGLGYQITDYTLSIVGEDFSGIAQDGFTSSAHVGYNLRVLDGLYLAPEVEAGVSDAAVEFGPLGDVIELDSFVNATVAAKFMISPQTWLGARFGYEQQYLSALGTDVTADWWITGAELGTEVYSGISLKLTADILWLGDVEVDGLTSDQNDFISDALENSSTLRIQARTSYRPPVPQSLSRLVGDR